MRKSSIAVLAITLLAFLGVACSSGGGPACASTLSVHDISLQHGSYITAAYVSRGIGGGGGSSHSGGGSSHNYKPPSNSGSKNHPAPKSSQKQTVSGSRSSSYKGPVSVSHSKYTYKAPNGTTHTYTHRSTSYYNGHYSSHYHWTTGALINYDPYNPWNYYNPYSPYYHVHLASC